MDVTIAWAAGLFEGEGCLALDRRGKGRICLTLASTDKDIVERFHAAIDCGAVFERHFAVHKDQWVWSVGGHDATRAIEMMLPWFGERRTLRAKELLDERAALIAQATRERKCSSCGAKFSVEFSSGWKKRTKCPSCSPLYLRRLDRESAMETVRDLSWS